MTNSNKNYLAWWFLMNRKKEIIASYQSGVARVTLRTKDDFEHPLPINFGNTTQIKEFFSNEDVLKSIDVIDNNLQNLLKNTKRGKMEKRFANEN